MLNPLVQWRDPAIMPNGRAVFRLDRGRIIVCKGETGRQRFEALWKTGGEAAGGRLIEMKRELPEFQAGEALFIRALAGREAGVHLADLESRLEAHAREGGGILIALADEISPPAVTQSLIPSPSWNADSPRLLDDQGLALRYARQGDWVQLYWPLPEGALAGAKTFSLRCSRGGDEWLSAPQPLAAWQPFDRGAKAVAAELAIPWPPGNYRLRLELNGGNADKFPRLPVLSLIVKPSAVNPLPHEFTPGWRLLGVDPMPPQQAGLSLSTAAARQLDLSPLANETLRGEWHQAENRADGGWRRWVGAFAQWSLRGSGELILDLEDHRARGSDGGATCLTLCLDGRVHARWELARLGAHTLRADWPEDGCAHLATLRVHPSWTPAEFGRPDDHRTLGVLINRCELSNG